MKTSIELADEFIESLVKGDIESYSVEMQQKLSVPAHRTITNQLDVLQLRIRDYRQVIDDEQRKGIAENILELVVTSRLNGILKNNPNTIRQVAEHRDYYKSRAAAAEFRVEYLEGLLKSAYTAIDNMESRIDKMGIKDKP